MSRRPRSRPERGSRRGLAVGFVALVGTSGALMALQGGASLPLVAASALGGVAVGAALLWYLTRIAR